MIEIEEKEQVEEKQKPPICSDYDMDCLDIKDPLNCFIGGQKCNLSPMDNITLIITSVPLADGICPMMKKKGE